METTTRKLPKPLFKMATQAWHKSIGWKMSMSIPDLCRVYEEDRRNFYGSWVLGIGAVGIKFPKKTTRDLTEAEAERESRHVYCLNGLRYTYSKGELLNRSRRKRA